MLSGRKHVIKCKIRQRHLPRSARRPAAHALPVLRRLAVAELCNVLSGVQRALKRGAGPVAVVSRVARCISWQCTRRWRIPLHTETATQKNKHGPKEPDALAAAPQEAAAQHKQQWQQWEKTVHHCIVYILKRDDKNPEEQKWTTKTARKMSLFQRTRTLF